MNVKFKMPKFGRNLTGNGWIKELLLTTLGMKFGSLFDANQTMVSKIGDGNSLVQVVAWYDNENSYTSQMVRTIKYLAELK